MMNLLLPSQPPRPVVPYQTSKLRLLVVGAGGTGSWVCQHLARLVWDFNRSWALVQDEKPRHASLTIVDFDYVEAGNIKARQNFCPAELGLPKAKVLAHRYGLAFGMADDEIAAVVAPFSPDLVQNRFDELTILVGCVDTAKARSEIAACVRNKNSYAPTQERVPMVWWVDSGNGLHSGQVVMGNTTRLDVLQGALRDPACLRLPSPDLLHPELLVPQPDELEESQQKLSCKDLVLLGEPEMKQSRTINNHMAALVYGYVEMLVYGGATTFATYTDLRSMTSRSLETTPEALALALVEHPTFFTQPPVEELEEEDEGV